MNSLQYYIRLNKLNEVEVMNLLQNHGIISDNCTNAADVGDSGKAVSFLNINNNKENGQD